MWNRSNLRVFWANLRVKIAKFSVEEPASTCFGLRVSTCWHRPVVLGDRTTCEVDATPQLPPAVVRFNPSDATRRLVPGIRTRKFLRPGPGFLPRRLTIRAELVGVGCATVRGCVDEFVGGHGQEVAL